MWAVIAAPTPLDILLLWYLLRRLSTMAAAYVAIWAIYLVLHMLPQCPAALRFPASRLEAPFLKRRNCSQATQMRVR